MLTMRPLTDFLSSISLISVTGSFRNTFNGPMAAKKGWGMDEKWFTSIRLYKFLNPQVKRAYNVFSFWYFFPSIELLKWNIIYSNG